MTPHAGIWMMLHSDPDSVKDGVDRRVLRRALHFARPYRWLIAAFVAIVVVEALLALVPPILFGRIIDDGIAEGDRQLVTALSLLVIGAALAEAALAFVERWCSARVGEGLILDLRTTLYDHVQRMPLSFFTHTQTGTLVSRVNNDVIGAQRAVTGTLGQVVSNAVLATSTVIAMLAIDWRLTLLAVGLLPLFLIPAKWFGRRLQHITREQMERNAAMNANMTERFGVAGAQLVKLFGRPEAEAAAFDAHAGAVRDLGVSSAMYSRTFFIAMSLVGAIGTAAVYWAGGLLAIDGAIQAGTLVTFTLLVGRVYGPLSALTNARVDVMTTLVSFERVFDVLDLPRSIDDRPGAVPLVDPVGRVELRHVTFTYPPADRLDIGGTAVVDDAAATPVLSDVDLVVEPGTMLALVGPSGAGKSTIAALLPRLYDVSEGSVLVDGQDVRDTTLDSLHAAIGVVTQDPHLFHDSVAANLRYARPDASDTELVAACRAAQIHDVIAALPDGYQTVVGERGYRLSGGEKQRLAIARVLLKDPAIVILDEATSHLDAENEALVQAALDRALWGRTSVVIAHRLSTVRSADQIVVLDQGRVMERGRHQELLTRRGLYADLYDTLLAEDRAPAAAG
jgi:ATP-binding cassette, subfamily B, bacterial